MNVEIGAEAVLFPEKEYINGIAVAVWRLFQSFSMAHTQGVKKRCRLSWLTNSTLVYEAKCSCGVSSADEYSCEHEVLLHV